MKVPLRWDVFCRVVDNFGDIGVCWRLAADLAGRGATVRLWTDDASALAWMAPAGAAGVQVLRWEDADTAPGDVVIEAFGCELPPAFVGRMAQAPPVWINLEYLSAEGYVERVHGLPSPQGSGPGAGLTKYFFYPGFTARTGGLLREPGLVEAQRAFDVANWLEARLAAALTPTLPKNDAAAPSPVGGGLGWGLAKWPCRTKLGYQRRIVGPHLGLPPTGEGEERSVAVPGRNRLAPEERVVSLFCYEQAALPALLDRLSRAPTLLLATAGQAAGQVRRLLGQTMQLGALRALALPALSQRDYDHLLWSSDLNFVRGEDSFVRAQWAARPFVWQIYPQNDGVHLDKLGAFLGRFDADPALGDFWLAWNTGATALPPLPNPGPWRAACEKWRAGLLAQVDLCSQLIEFVAETR